MKNKMLRKTLAACVAAVMTLSLVGCGSNNEKKETPASSETKVEATATTAPTEVAATEAPVVEEEPYEVLKDANGNVYDLGGIEIVLRDWWSDGIVKEPTNAYEEARRDYVDWIQETYNFKIKELAMSDYGSSAEDFLNYATTGGDENFIFILGGGGQVVSAMQSGLMYDLSTLDCLDFTENKWSSGVHKVYSKGDSIYCMRGIAPEPRDGMYFNKRLLEEAGINPADIYKLQENNEWTWAKFEELCKQIHVDTDNDGVVDRYAMVADSSTMFLESVWSNNAEFIGRSDEGFVNKVESDETMQALNWALEMMAKYRYMPEGAQWDYWKTSFVNGDAAFIAGQAYLACNDFKDMEDDFGYVCFPMGPNSTDYTNCYTDNLYTIPACYDAQKAWNLAFAYNLYTEPVPGYEDYNVFAESSYNGFRDTESVDFTINRLCKNGKVTYHDLIPGLKLGEQFIWTLGDANPPAQQAEVIRNEWASYIDAANGK